jgi:hypothetical protein
MVLTPWQLFPLPGLSHCQPVAVENPSQAGLPNLWVRRHVSLGQKGHIVHVASLCGEDILESDASQNPPERFWQAGESGGYAAAGTRLLLEASFRDDAGPYQLALYERAGAK